MPYATIAELRESLSITTSDRDPQLSDVLARAEQFVDDHCGRTFGAGVTSRRRWVPPRASSKYMEIDDVSSSVGLVVEIRDVVTDALVSPVPDAYLTPLTPRAGRPWTGLARAAGAWPRSASRQAVAVTASWGWPEVPAPVKGAVLMQAARLWARRGSPEGVLGSSEWGGVRVARVDPDVREMLAPYVRPAVG